MWGCESGGKGWGWKGSYEEYFQEQLIQALNLSPGFGVTADDRRSHALERR